MTKTLIEVKGSDPVVSSLVIAEQFGRRHKNVLQRLDRLNENGRFTGLDFKPSEYVDASGKTNRMIELTERGFLIAMPFIGGKKAEDGQVRLVDEFLRIRNLMARELKRQATETRQRIRREAAVEAKVMCASLQRAREMDGKATEQRHYINEHKLVNFALTGEYKGLNRETLSDVELKVLAELETENSILLRFGKSRDERRAALLARKAVVLNQVLPKHEAAARLAH